MSDSNTITRKTNLPTDRYNNVKDHLMKLPPQDLEVEQAALGVLMIEEDALDLVLDVLKKENFYDPRHELIYEAITQLFDEKKKVDILTVRTQLIKMGKLEMIGGAYYLSELTDKIASGSNVEAYAKIIIEKSILRQLIKATKEVEKDAFEPTSDALETLDKAEQKLFEISQNSIRKDYQQLNDILKDAVKHLDEIVHNKEHEHTGIPSGFHELDKITSGWQNSDLIVIAGRPGTGKTAFVLNCARNAAIDYKIPIAIFSLEMASVQLVNRFISSETEIEQNKLRQGRMNEKDWERINKKVTELEDAPIFIDDTPALNLFEFQAKSRRLKSKHNVQLIIVDYLQLMKGREESNKHYNNREQEIRQISGALKQVAKELNIPIIALSQLSREVEKRSDQKSKPRLSDLRESGAIEQDADIVCFLYRPDKYNIETLDDGSNSKGICQLLIEKHRNGETGSVNVRFIDKFVKFVNYNQFEPMINDLEMGEDSIQTKQSKANGNNIENDEKLITPF